MTAQSIHFLQATEALQVNDVLMGIGLGCSVHLTICHSLPDMTAQCHFFLTNTSECPRFILRRTHIKSIDAWVKILAL